MEENFGNFFEAIVNLLNNILEASHKQTRGIEDLRDFTFYLDILKISSESQIEDHKIYREREDQMLIEINLGVLLAEIKRFDGLEQEIEAKLKRDLKQDSENFETASLWLFRSFLLCLRKSSLCKDLEDSLERLSHQDREIIHLIEDEDYYNSQREPLSGERSNRDKQLSNLPQHLKSDKMLKEILDENDNLRTQNSLLNQKLLKQAKNEEELQKEQERMEAQYSVLKMRVQELEGVNQRLVWEKDEQESRLQESEHQNQRQNQSLQELQRQLQTKEMGHSQEIERLTQENKSVKERNYKLENELSKLSKYKENYSELQQTNIKLQGELRDDQQLLQKTQNQLSQSIGKNERQKQQLAELRQELQQKDLMITVLQSEREIDQQRLEKRNEENAKLRMKLEDAENRLSQLEQESHRSNSSNTGRYNNLSEELEGVVQEKEKKILELHQEVERLAQELEGLEQLKWKVPSQERAIEHFKAKNLELVQALSGHEVLEREVDDLKKSLEVVTEEKGMLQKKLLQVKSERERLQEDLAKQDKLSLALQEKCSVLELKSLEQERNLQSQSTKLLELSSLTGIQEVQVKNLQDQIRKLKAIQQDATENKRIQELSEDLNQQIEQLDRVVAQKHELERTIRSLHTEMSELRMSSEILKHQIESKNVEIESLLEMHQNHQRQKAQLQEELREINNTNQQYYQQQLKLRDTNQSWNKKIAEIQKQNNEEIRLLVSVIVDLRQRFQVQKSE